MTNRRGSETAADLSQVVVAGLTASGKVVGFHSKETTQMMCLYPKKRQQKSDPALLWRASRIQVYFPTQANQKLGCQALQLEEQRP